MRFLLVILLCIVCVDSFAGYSDNEDFIAEERWDDFGYDSANSTWWGTTGGITYSGVAVCSAQYGSENMVQYEIDTTPGGYCWCKTTSPFNGMFVHWTSLALYEGEICVSMCAEMCVSEQPMGGAGLPAKAEHTMKFHNILIQKPILKCDVSLHLSTGLVYSLYLEKETSPALGVRNGEQVCWGRLEPGQASPGLNIKYNGDVYHFVD